MSKPDPVLDAILEAERELEEQTTGRYLDRYRVVLDTSSTMWVVTMHDSSGSAAESIDSIAGLGPFTQAEAIGLMDQINALLRVSGADDEYFATAHEIENPLTMPTTSDPAELAKLDQEPEPGKHMVADVREWLRATIEQHEEG